MNQQIDLRNVDIVRMAEDDGVQLRGNPNGTLCGPCPKCGGDDRFAVITNARAGVQLWRCRKCFGDQLLDAIRYLQHMRGLAEWRVIFDQLRAYGYSGTRSESSSAQPIRKQISKPITREGLTIPDQLESPPSDEWQDSATIHALECMRRLWNSDGARALEYLRTKRMLADHTIRKFGLGFCDRTDKASSAWRGITIPRSYGGALWSINVRTNEANGTRKYLLRAGSRTCAPFNGDALANPAIRNVIICEGEFDAMLIDQHAPEGFAAITFGGKSIAPSYEAVLLLRNRRCYCAFDADDAGDAGAIAWQKIAKRARVPHGKDITEFVQRGGDLRQWIVSLTHDDFVQEARAMIEARGMVAIWQNAK